MQRFSSIFSQLLQLFPRLEFEQAVRRHNAQYAAKGFTTWGQFVAMLFCQFGDNRLDTGEGLGQHLFKTGKARNREGNLNREGTDSSGQVQ